MAHVVVAVADPGQPPALEVAQPLAQRLHVGQRLARMVQVGQAVDHRRGGRGRQLLDVGVRVGADHDRVQVAAEHDAGVADRLAPAQLHLGGGQVDGAPAQLVHADLERHARARRRLLEDQPERPPGQQGVGDPRALHRLQLVGQIEHGDHLLGREILDAQEVATGERGRVSTSMCMSIPSRWKSMHMEGCAGWIASRSARAAASSWSTSPTWSSEVVARLDPAPAAVLLHVPHTTAGVTINEGYDPAVADDVLDVLRRLVPRGRGVPASGGQLGQPRQGDRHGIVAARPGGGGAPMLGRWQRIFFCEFDGPRSRQLWVSPIG